MKVIKCLSEKIQEELHDADAYITLAMEWKEEEPDVAELFYELSKEEISHADRLHESVKEKIEEYKEENGDPPKGMLALYNFMHEKEVADAMMIKVKQGMYKAD